MNSGPFARKVAQTRWARVAAMPVRARAVFQNQTQQLRMSARWLVQSREHTNYTYDLAELNLSHLAWWVSMVTGAEVAQARSAMNELQTDLEIQDQVREATLRSDRRGISDPEARFGRRLGWYAVVRLTRPALVVETGTDKGLGSLAIARALQLNGCGRLLTVDTNPDAGLLLRGFEGPWDIHYGDSIEALSSVSESVDLFIHDSLHTVEHERGELKAIEGQLSQNGIAMSDNSHVTNALAAWAEANGKRFLFFSERPKNHWYAGGGIGAAWAPGASRP